MEHNMQTRIVVAGIACLMMAGTAWAQTMQDDQQPNVQQQATSPTQSQSQVDSSVGGVAGTRSQYGGTRTTDQRCSFKPTCDIFFGN
jgi:hypothetical protein